MEQQNRPEWESKTSYEGASPLQNEGKSPKNNKKVWILILALILAVLLVVGGGIGIGYWIYTANTNSSVTTSDSSSTASNDQTSSDTGITIESKPNDEEVELPDGRLTSVQVAQKVTPSVVAIVVYEKDSFGIESATGSGSGVIMSEDGYILTCSHVINDGDVSGKLEIVYTDGSTSKAEIVGYDTQTDLAVLKTNKTGLTPAEFGDSNELMVGEVVYVIGSPSGVEYLGSFAGGYVSAVNREITVGTQKFKLACIQTDAAINPGNSGGPLINEYGQVVGINSAKLVSTNVEGMGFAIPSNTAQSVVSSLLESGYVTGRPRIGITFTGISEDLAKAAGIPQGIRIVGIDETCDVANKDVKIGDIVVAVDGEQVIELTEITAVLGRKQPGDSVTLSIYRVEENGNIKTFDVDVVLSEKTE